MKTRLIQIGNSRGIRLPKSIIEQAGLTDEIELRIQDGAIVIARVDRPRVGWAEAATLLLKHKEGCLVDKPIPARFDEEEWEW
jgi:antitoxin MazE